MLEQLIETISSDTFLQEVFEKRPAYLGRMPACQTLFTIDDFDQYLIEQEGRLQDAVRISRGGTTLDVPSFQGHSEPQREFVLRAFASGATLKLEDLEFRNSKLATICRKIEMKFGGSCFAKPFLTGPTKTGLNVHFDTTEVFVMQLHGTKHWQIWNRLEVNPTLAMQRGLDPSTLGQPVIERTLYPGDILYIPAGTPHCASCGEDASLHMAFGLSPIKFFEVLETHFRIQSESCEALRENVFPWTARDEISDSIQRGLVQAQTVAVQTQLTNLAIARNSTSRDISNKRLRSTIDLTSLGLNTRLEVRQGMSLVTRRIEADLRLFYSSSLSPGKPTIETPAFLKIPALCEPVLAWILERRDAYFTPSNLPSILSDDSKLVFCRQLLKAGILTVH